MHKLMRYTLFGLFGIPPVLAHDLRIERDGRTHALVYGHERSGHEGVKSIEYKPDSVKESLCFNAAGQEIDSRRSAGLPATIQGDCASSWFLISSGYWSKTPYGTTNRPKNETDAVIESWLSIEGVKRIDEWGPGLARPLTQSLELSPLNNPLKLGIGDKLRLRAWYRGKPAAHVTVAYFGRPRGVTDAGGKINIRLASPGFQSIHGSIESPLNDGKADKAIHATSLQFELP